MERIFPRSIETRRLFIQIIMGTEIPKVLFLFKNLYAPKVLSKKECIGHVQKRVGTRLRELKKTEKDLIKLGLADKIIDRLQNYYGVAVRSNVGDLDTMKKLFFCTFSCLLLRRKKNYHRSLIVVHTN